VRDEGKGRIWLEGAGVGILLTLGFTWNQLSSYHLDLYHRLLPITTVLRAFAIYVMLACLFGVGLLWLLDKLDRRGKTLLWALFGAALIARTVSGLMIADVVRDQHVTVTRVFLLCLAIALLIWLLARPVYTIAVRMLRFLLLLVGFCIFWVLPMMIYMGLVHQPSDVASFVKPIPDQPKPHRRLVWLLFDELSYDQLFDHRQPGLALPNFDRLRTQSVNFSNVQPAGYFTELVVPSVFLGKPLAEVRSTLQGQLLVHGSGESTWEKFNPDATIFADAKHKGFTTGIVGGWNPYCRLLPQQLDFCWQQLFLFRNHFASRFSTIGNVLVPVRASIARFKHQQFKTEPTDTERLDELIGMTEALVKNEDIDFAFAHLPIPHQPNLYSRSRNRKQPGGSYLDNLVFADQTLALFLQALNETHSASMATLVISSDHSWRVPMWRGEKGWTAEDEKASQGRFDTRPVLLIHFSGQTNAVDEGGAFPLVNMHDILEKILTGEIVSPAQLNAWVQAKS